MSDKKTEKVVPKSENNAPKVEVKKEEKKVSKEDKTVDFGEITTQEQAEDFAKKAEFKGGIHGSLMYITQDGNAFWPKDLGACNTHCRKYKKKKFAVKV